MAEKAGFEPAVRYYRTHAFQACTFSRSVTSPFAALFRAAAKDKPVLWREQYVKDVSHLFLPDVY